MDIKNYTSILNEAKQKNANLIVVTKNQSLADIQFLYEHGCRMMAENRVQALSEKKAQLPKDIQWHLIGNLQKNKVKQVVPFISCIHSVDSFELAHEIDKQATKFNRIIPILFEIKIAAEESKQGFDVNDILHSLEQDPWHNFHHLKFSGLMGMASFVSDDIQIRKEFNALHNLFNLIKNKYPQLVDFTELSMGMSGDYKLALDEGATMIRVGSRIFA